jgi:phosphate starvation-inducible PhoH-like protein
MKSLEESLSQPEGKKKGRKPKRTAQKELINMYYEEVGIERDSKEVQSYYANKSIVENYQHLSPLEKQRFESKFTQPKNVHQEQYLKLLQQKSKKIIVVSGPAGTGKTLFAVENGVRNFLLGKIDKLIFTRPSVSVDEDLGYLPGTLEEKMAPWVRPIYDVLYQFLTPKDVQQQMEDKLIEIAPLGYMRGRTFKNTWIIADEMQNSTVAQMKMLLTRLGENSRLIITGDLEQYDRPDTINGLEDFLQKFKGKRSSSISNFEFERADIQREEVVKEVLDIYSGECIPQNYLDEEDS